MSQEIEKACLEVAQTNMFEGKPIDAEPMIAYHQKLVAIGLEALEHHKGSGATEQDIANAIYYIAQVYALPPIKDNIKWFSETLHTILEIAFPNSGITGNAVSFAKKLMAGLKEQLKP